MKDHAEWAVSCLLDDTPSLWSCLAVWLASALEVARIPASQIHVHHVCALREEALRMCLDAGVRTHRVDQFHARHPHTNKIRQCFTDYGSVRRVMLTDVDTAFAGAPDAAAIFQPVAGKPVDLPNPPYEILLRLFEAAGLQPPEALHTVRSDGSDTLHTFATLPGNFNGGMYAIDSSVLGKLGSSWSKWALWLIPQVNMLGRWAMHVDQIAFCLAVNELRIPLQHLDDTWNLPIHLGAPPPGADPILIHHHGLLLSDDDPRIRNYSRIANSAARIRNALRIRKMI